MTIKREDKKRQLKRVDALTKIRVYGYRRNGSFKIYFPILYQKITSNETITKHAESVRLFGILLKEENFSNASRIAKKEAERLNKKYNYKGFQSMVFLQINKITFKI